MPVVAAVFPEAKVLRQSAQIFGTSPAGHVARYRIGCFLKRGEALFHIRRHESEDFLNTLHVHLRGDVDEDQRRKSAPSGLCVFSLRDHARDAAQRCANQDRRHGEAVRDVEEILRETLHSVVSVRRPVAFAVPAQIDGEGVVSVLSQPFTAGLPSMACLSAAMGEHDRTPMVGAECVRRDFEILDKGEQGPVF